MNPRLLAPARLARSILRTQSDERLAELAAAGSDAAFEALVARHRRSLVGSCTRLVGAADAEEAVQDALLRALTALRRGDEVRQVAPWLHVIARHVALNLRRARAARGERALADVAGGEPADDGVPAAVRAQLREVVAAVGALPPRQRDAIVMRELEGRSYVEIAERMGSSPGAVRQLLHRARAEVRERAGGLLAWEPLVRWTTSLAPGSRVGALADSCLATAKVCAALVPTAVLGAGGVTALEHHPHAPPRAARTASSSSRPRVVTAPVVAAAAVHHWAAPVVAVARRAPGHATSSPRVVVRFVSGPVTRRQPEASPSVRTSRSTAPAPHEASRAADPTDRQTPTAAAQQPAPAAQEPIPAAQPTPSARQPAPTTPTSLAGSSPEQPAG